MDKNWPAWRYGPNGRSDVFNNAAEVPNGWQDHPSKVGTKPAAPAAPAVPASAAPSAPAVPASAAPSAPAKGGENGEEIDSAGWPFDEALHASTRTKTTAGLWRMKVGVSRPDPKPDFPKPALDL